MTNRPDDHLDLVLFFSAVGPAWTWRQPDSLVEGLWGAELPTRIAQQAERAVFDALFIGSWLSPEGGEMGQQPFTAGYEPFTLIGALSAQTERIGLIATGSTTFVHPYNMARYLVSLDWLSSGRVGWNVVTSSGGGEHYGLGLPPKETRYARAEEYLEVTNALWDAWDDDAVINDRKNGVWARSDSIHPVDLQGDQFQVAGQLFMHRSPQGRPVIVQAGQSSAGMEFAARHAEVVFTAQTELDTARGYYQELKERAAAAGRAPSDIKIYPGFMPTVGETLADALSLQAALDGQIDPTAGRARAAAVLQADLTDLPVDQPIPAHLLASPDSVDAEKTFGSRYRNFYDLAVVEQAPLRRVIGAIVQELGHLSVTGSAEEVADRAQEWFEAGACDGFAVIPPSMPEGFDQICDHLMPELRRRGLAKSAYRGVTLREQLGLSRPPSPPRPA